MLSPQRRLRKHRPTLSAHTPVPISTSTNLRRSKEPAPRTETQQRLLLPYAIVVGLPKSGTTSLYHFFSCSGYPTTHYGLCGSNATEYPCDGGKLLSEQLKEILHAGRPLWLGAMLLLFFLWLFTGTWNPTTDPWATTERVVVVAVTARRIVPSEGGMRSTAKLARAFDESWTHRGHIIREGGYSKILLACLCISW